MKVILNKRFGGFRPSVDAYRLYGKKTGVPVYPYKMDKIEGRNCWYRRYDGDDTGDIWLEYFTKDFGEYAKFDGDEWDYSISLDGKNREDPVLIEVVEELGEKASSRVSWLKVVNIPDGLDYVVDDYDGFETLHKRVKTW